MEETVYETLERILAQDPRVTIAGHSESKERFLEDVSKKVVTDLGNHFCSTCGGTGHIASMERVYPGEPHMADVGEPRPCPEMPHNVID